MMDADGDTVPGDQSGEEEPQDTVPDDVKQEPQEVEMKGYAEDTMNELLGIYGYDGVDKSMTDNLHLHHFASEDQETNNPGASAASSKQTMEKSAVDSKTSTEKGPATDKQPDGPITRRRASSTSSHQQEVVSAAPITGSDKQTSGQTKSSKTTVRRKAVSTNPALPGGNDAKKRKRQDSSSSEDSDCSCGSCDSDDEGGAHHSHMRPDDIIRDVQRLVDQNRALRKENRKLKSELKESLNVKQLSQDIRQLTSRLQGGGSSSLSPLPRPSSNSSVSSSTPHRVTSSAKKIPRPRPTEPDGDEEEQDSDRTEELWPDSGIMLPASQIQKALDCAQQNYRLFTRSLMEMIFTRETMAASSARGQKPLGKNAPENANPRPPLDQNAVQAIVSRVCSEFPEVHQTLVMSVVRQKIADVRKRLKIQTERGTTQQETV